VDAANAVTIHTSIPAGDSQLTVPGMHSLRTVRRCGRNALAPGQARANGIATNLVTLSDFSRISTARLPFL
jgi:hypothetical protein